MSSITVFITMQRESNRLFSKSLLYVIFVYILQILNILLNILLIRNLSLENLGQIALAKVYFQFMDFLHLGSRFSMDRYIPVSDDVEGRLITNFTLMLSSTSAFVFIIIVYFFIEDDSVVLIYMLAGFIFAQGTIYKAYFRAKENIKSMLIVVLLTMFIPIMVQIIAILFYSFEIFVVSFLISYIVGFVLLTYKFRLVSFPSLTDLILKSKLLFRSSSLLFVSSLIVFVSFSIDKILLGEYRGSEVLGEYSIITFVFATLLIIPGTLAELIFPRIIKNVSKTAKAFYLKEMSFVFFPTLLAVALANVFMDFFIIKFTDYAYLLAYLHMISWAVVPYAIISIMFNTMNALDKRENIVKINLIALAFYITFLYFAMNFSEDILGMFVYGRYIHILLLFSLYFFYLRSQDLNALRSR